MLLRLCFTITLLASLTYACDCSEPSVQVKREHADLIFRGTIIALRDAKAAKDLPSIRKKVAVFRVIRVWKGDVSETFEMPAFEETSACMGFWPPYLKVGSDLLVYAQRIGSEYYTSICGFHKLARDPKDNAEKDFVALGPGVTPLTKKDRN